MLSWATLFPRISSGWSTRSLTSEPRSVHPPSLRVARVHYGPHARPEAARAGRTSQQMPPPQPTAAAPHPRQGGSDRSEFRVAHRTAGTLEEALPRKRLASEFLKDG